MNYAMILFAGCAAAYVALTVGYDVASSLHHVNLFLALTNKG